MNKGIGQIYLRTPGFAIGMTAMATSLLYLFSVTSPVLGGLIQYAVPFPLFALAWAHGFRATNFSIAAALLGIACAGSIGLILHFSFTIALMAFWFSFVLSSPLQGKKQKILLGWIALSLVGIAFNLDAGILQNLEKAMDLFWEKQVAPQQISNLVLNKDDLKNALKVMPAVMAIMWLYLQCQAINVAHRFVTPQGKPIKSMRFFDLPLPEGCFYGVLIAVAGCFLSDPQLKLFSLNALVFLLFPFALVGMDFFGKKIDEMSKAKLVRVLFYIFSFIFLWVLLLAAFVGLGLFLKEYRFPLKFPAKNTTST